MDCANWVTVAFSHFISSYFPNFLKITSELNTSERKKKPEVGKKRNISMVLYTRVSVMSQKKSHSLTLTLPCSMNHIYYES